MKRLCQMGFDTLLTSFLPILMWMILGMTIDKSLVNVFMLIYAIQFLALLCTEFFAVGANMYASREKDLDAVYTSIVLGFIFGLFLFGGIAFRIDDYLRFMNTEVDTYHWFGMYAVLHQFLAFLLMLVLHKLYFEGRNKEANKYSLIFNSLMFIITVGLSLIVKNQVIIVWISLSVLIIYILYLLSKEIKPFHFSFPWKKFLRYNSVEIIQNVIFFFIYLFGISNTTTYGEEFLITISFVTLVCDAQWDMTSAIITAAKIDLSNHTFNYKTSIKNALKYTYLLMASSIVFALIMYSFYQPNLLLVLLFGSYELCNFIGYPFYYLRICYLQVEGNPVVATIHKTVAYLLRLGCSFLPTAFCTLIGQAISFLYQWCVFMGLFKQKFRIEEDGTVLPKRMAES